LVAGTEKSAASHCEKSVTMIKKFVSRSIATRRIAVLCSIGFAVLGVWLATPLILDEPSAVLRMSAGPNSTRRQVIATYLSEQAADNELIVKLTPNAGSEECLNLLKAGELDAAIVSSGVKVTDDDDIMVLGAMQLELVHVLVRKDLAEAGPLARAIQGKRISIGVPGSTEWLLAREFLKFARLELPTRSDAGDVLLMELSKAQLIAQAEAIQQAKGADRQALIAALPDCVVLLASMPSPIAQQLIEAADYRLVPLPATRAFLMDNLQDSDSKTTVLEREFLEHAVIPTSSYFTTQGFPAADCETVAVRLLAVARKDAAEEAIGQLMETIFEGEFCHRIRPISPREIATPYAIHPAAIDYLDRDQPLAIGELIEWCSNGLSFLGAFAAGALSLYSLLRSRSARQPADYFAEIRAVDRLAGGDGGDSTVPIEPRELAKHLDDRLLKLRQELIEDICSGSIKGDQVILNILTLLNDTRANLQQLEAAAEKSNKSRALKPRLAA
jgi:TRAP-type uncharacterized transport system substrate-binding protein